MAFSTVAAEIIFFIVVIVAATAVAGVFTSYFNTFGTSINEQTKFSKRQLNTRITLSDVTATPNDLNASLRNIGTETLDQNYLDVFVDGLYVPRDQVTILMEQSTDTVNVGLWDSLERVKVHIDNLGLTANTTYTLMVETENGVSTVRKFTPGE